MIYADTRAYVWSAAVLEGGVKALQRQFRLPNDNADAYGHWIKLLNVDTPGQVPSETHYGVSEFERKWARQRTYHRWESAGTWYGFSYHSGVMLTASKDRKKSNLRYCGHFRDMYFDQTLLLLYIRVSLFRFSTALSSIASDKDTSLQQVTTIWGPDFEALRHAFSRFTILFQYPLLSNQQQSIEMYELARRHLDIGDFYREVKSEVDDTHEFLELCQARQLARFANLLAVIGLPLVVAGLVAALFGMNADILPWVCVNGTATCVSLEWFWLQAGLAVIAGIATGFLALAASRRRERKRS